MVNMKDKYIGMTKTMNNGMEATIVAYRKTYAIDIRFEDGTVVKNKSVSNFQKGTIAYPGMNINNKRCENKYIGLTNIMNNGMNATIIVYRKNDDIDVQFEDGTVVYKKNVSSFKNGNIAHPGMNTNNKRCENKYIGLTNIMNNGMKATIIEYTTCDRITVRFEDGTVVCNKTVGSFKNGNIAHPNLKRGKKDEVKNLKI